MKKTAFDLTGSIVAIVTPFNKNGSIDYDSYHGLLKFHLENGTDGIVVCGTTGEASTLTNEEYQTLIAFTVEKVNAKIPVIAGVGTNSTATTLANIKVAESQGVNGFLVVSPYYNKPTQEGLYLHFEAVAKSTELPVILYNVPGRTGGNMSAELTLKLANNFKNIVAIKEASGNMAQIMEIIAQRPQEFKVYSGDDILALPIVALGGEGCISTTANTIPGPFSRLIHAAMEGNFMEARKIHNLYLTMMQLNFIESNPGPIKAALSRMGYINEDVRLPLCTMNQKNKELLWAELEKLELVQENSFA
jgi:4-hydroxy-tetrahydrodipicolinate synthase